MVTDAELLELVKRALADAPNAGALGEATALREDTLEQVEAMYMANLHMLAAATRAAWAYQQRARQLRAGGA